MTPLEKAQQGKAMILDAMMDVLRREHPKWIRHRGLVAELQLESEYQGGQRNYVTASLLDELERAGKVVKAKENARGPMSYRLAE